MAITTSINNCALNFQVVAGKGDQCAGGARTVASGGRHSSPQRHSQWITQVKHILEAENVHLIRTDIVKTRLLSIIFVIGLYSAESFKITKWNEVKIPAMIPERFIHRWAVSEFILYNCLKLIYQTIHNANRYNWYFFWFWSIQVVFALFLSVDVNLLPI